MRVQENAMGTYDPIPKRVNDTGTTIVEAAIQVHTTLGPGLLESAYVACLIEELRSRGCSVRTEVAVPVVYRNTRLKAGFRLDILVNECVIIEVKAQEGIHPVHQSQVLTYVKLSGHRVGYLLNFNVHLMKEGIRRLAV